MNLQELKDKLGMTPGDLLTSTSGREGDLLDVQGDFAIVGVIATGEVLAVPIWKICQSREEADQKLKERTQ